MTAPLTPDVPTSGLHVTAVLLAERIDDALIDALWALADQDLPADALVVLDATPAGDLTDRLPRSQALIDHLPMTTVVRVSPGSDLRVALPEAVMAADAAAADEVDPDTSALWLLTGATVPERDALAHLAATIAGSHSVGMAAPKLTDANRTSRLQRFGIQVTRSGRLQLNPRPGQPDQQQFDDRVDALAAPAEGLLLRRTTYADLGAHCSTLGPLGSDLDYGWRAQLAGHRVELSPRARVRLGTAYALVPSAAERRDARRVALARGPILSAPLRALWMALSTAAVALGLAVLKRPAAARRQAGDLIALLDPWRPAAARWRTRGRRRVRHRDLRGLFVTPSQARARARDRLHDVLVPRRAGARAPASRSPGETRPLISSPAVWGTLVVAGLAAAAARTLPGSLDAGLATGFHGGQLRPLSSDAAALWHSWWDGWVGSGAGVTGPGAPGSGILALLTWLFQALPGDAGPNPAGRVVGLLVMASLPLAALSAYAAARVATDSRLPRAAVALLWVVNPVAVTALAQGRLGPLAALVALPVVLAGLVSMTRPSVRPGVMAMTALAAAGLATVLPGTLALVGALTLGLVLAGGRVARVRAVGFVPLVALAAAPTLLRLKEQPAGLLAGWGALASQDAPPPWQLALLHPGPTTPDGSALAGTGDYRMWLAVPVLALGVLGLARPARRPRFAAAAALLALGGLALALASPHLQVGTATDATVLSPWPGIGLLVFVAGLLGAGLLAFDDPASADSRVAQPAAGRHAPAHRAAAPVAPGAAWRAPAAIVAGLGGLALAGHLAWSGLGTGLSPAADPRPAVAIDQAVGPAATRTLTLRPDTGTPSAPTGLTYDLIGREPGLPARDLSVAAADAHLERQIAALVDASANGIGADPARGLAQWAIGFVVADGELGAPLIRQLDATSGLTRIGDYRGRPVWRVEPESVADRLAPARVRLVPATSPAPGWGSTVPVAGSHAATRAPLSGQGTLVIAEPAGWADRAVVSASGTRLAATVSADGLVTYAVPAGADAVRIAVPPQHRLGQWAYLAALLLLVYLAIPLGAPPRSVAAAAGATSIGAPSAAPSAPSPASAGAPDSGASITHVPQPAAPAPDAPAPVARTAEGAGPEPRHTGNDHDALDEEPA